MKLSGFEEASKELGLNLNFFFRQGRKSEKEESKDIELYRRVFFIFGFKEDISTEGRIELKKYTIYVSYHTLKGKAPKRILMEREKLSCLNDYEVWHKFLKIRDKT